MRRILILSTAVLMASCASLERPGPGEPPLLRPLKPTVEIGPAPTVPNVHPPTMEVLPLPPSVTR